MAGQVDRPKTEGGDAEKRDKVSEASASQLPRIRGDKRLLTLRQKVACEAIRKLAQESGKLLAVLRLSRLEEGLDLVAERVCLRGVRAPPDHQFKKAKLGKSDEDTREATAASQEPANTDLAASQELDDNVWHLMPVWAEDELRWSDFRHTQIIFAIIVDKKSHNLLRLRDLEFYTIKTLPHSWSAHSPDLPRPRLRSHT